MYKCKRCKRKIQYKTWKKYEGYSRQCFLKIKIQEESQEFLSVKETKDEEIDLIDEMESLLNIKEDGEEE